MQENQELNESQQLLRDNIKLIQQIDESIFDAKERRKEVINILKDEGFSSRAIEKMIKVIRKPENEDEIEEAKIYEKVAGDLVRPLKD